MVSLYPPPHSATLPLHILLWGVRVTSANMSVNGHFSVLRGPQGCPSAFGKVTDRTHTEPLCLAWAGPPASPGFGWCPPTPASSGPRLTSCRDFAHLHFTQINSTGPSPARKALQPPQPGHTPQSSFRGTHLSPSYTSQAPLWAPGHSWEQNRPSPRTHRASTLGGRKQRTDASLSTRELEVLNSMEQKPGAAREGARPLGSR